MEIIKIFNETLSEELEQTLKNFVSKTPFDNIETNTNKKVVCVLVDEGFICGASVIIRDVYINKKKYFLIAVYVLPKYRNRTLTKNTSLLESSFEILKNEQTYEGIVLNVVNDSVTDEILKRFNYEKDRNYYKRLFKE